MLEKNEPSHYYLIKMAQSSQEFSQSGLLKKWLYFIDYYVMNKLPSMDDQVNYVSKAEKFLKEISYKPYYSEEKIDISKFDESY